MTGALFVELDPGDHELDRAILAIRTRLSAASLDLCGHPAEATVPSYPYYWWNFVTVIVEFGGSKIGTENFSTLLPGGGRPAASLFILLAPSGHEQLEAEAAVVKTVPISAAFSVEVIWTK